MSNRVLVICPLRLGDIVANLPAARFLAEAGHEVDFCCYPQYHSIFEAVSYCRPVDRDALRRQGDYAHVYNLEITRAQYDAWRASRIKWRDYVYGRYPELAPVRTTPPLFDRMPSIAEYQLPESYALASPFGISQVTQVHGGWFRQQCEALSSGPWYVLTDRRPGRRLNWGAPIHARSLAHLPALIAGATTFVTINSSPNIIASGVRSSWYKVDEPGFGGQDNYEAPGQIILRQPPELARRRSWRFWVHYWRRKLMGIDTSIDEGK
jgi:hypothetical protein